MKYSPDMTNIFSIMRSEIHRMSFPNSFVASLFLDKTYLEWTGVDPESLAKTNKLLIEFSAETCEKALKELNEVAEDWYIAQKDIVKYIELCNLSIQAKRLLKDL